MISQSDIEESKKKLMTVRPGNIIKIHRSAKQRDAKSMLIT